MVIPVNHGFRLAAVFSRSNSKLGRVYSFSIPAVATCPGSSALCRELCYATRTQSRFGAPSVQEAYWRNFAFSKREDFPLIVTDLLGRTRRDRPLVRLHVSGDFYSGAYARKWLTVIKSSQQIRFLAYTRSWRVPAVAGVLAELAEQPNLQLFYSADRETGLPLSKPAAVRVAWMQTRESDVRRRIDLVFRTHNLRKVVQKQVAGTLVCPVENGVTHTTCDRCQVCFSDPEEDQTRRTKDRFALSLV